MAASSHASRRPPHLLAICLALLAAAGSADAVLQDCSSTSVTAANVLAIPEGSECQLTAGTYTFSGIEVS